jgi:4-aminobutyrate aminotransferase-like enzyme
VLISAAGPHVNVLKIRPPLVFSTGHADLLVERLDQALLALHQA